MSCSAKVRDITGVIESIPYDIDRYSVVIGRAGIPLAFDGYQLTPGVTESVQLGIGTGVAQIRSVYTDPKTGCLFAEFDASVTAESQGTAISFSGVGGVAYCPSYTGGDGIDHGIDYILAPTDTDNALPITLEISCDGINLSPVGE